MKRKLEIKSLFAYSAKSSKCSLYEFGPGTNIITGQNTSGKSSVFKAIIFCFGINDGKDHLAEILNEEVIFRLDCTVSENGSVQPLMLIRENETLFVKYGETPVRSFNGMIADHSFEHVKLKKYISELFGFSLQLESQNEYKPAPLEAMFLPYYVSQAVGWVYIRKSFSNLDFYRNFKEDYLDYYLGVENFSDRIEKHRLEELKRALEDETKFYASMQIKDLDLQVTTLLDEQFSEHSRRYFESHKSKLENLLKSEKEHLLECNQLSYFKQRRAVLTEVAGHQKDQDPNEGHCPICSQSLPSSILANYVFMQERNDTDNEIKYSASEIKKAQSKINSLRKQIDDVRSQIGEEYEVLKMTSAENLSIDGWLGYKANVRLIERIETKLGKIAIEIASVKERLAAFKSEEEISAVRNKWNKVFKEVFQTYLAELGVKPLEEDRFTQLYKISAFPYQGVELLKTLLAYHLAFNNLVKLNPNVHRFPFMLDAIFKEDVTHVNRELIVKLISKHRPTDTQLLVSISRDAGEPTEIGEYNRKYFNNEATVLTVGDGTNTRAFLKPYDSKSDDGKLGDLIKSTLEITNGIY